MSRRLLVIGIVLATIVVTTVLAFNAWSKELEARPKMTVQVKTIAITNTNSLLGDAKPLPWRVELVDSNKVSIPIGVEGLESGKVVLLRATLGTETVYIVLRNTGNGLRASAFSPDGTRLESKLIPVNSVAEKTPAHIEAVDVSALINRVKKQLDKIGVAVTSEALNKAKEFYSEAQAYRAVNARAYKLEVKLPGKGYTPLAYLLWASSCLQWQIASHTVYEVCAEGTFYVNPGVAVYVIQDNSHYTVNPPLSNCKFTHSASNTPASATIRADGEAALLDCPVTTKYSASASETIDIWGGFHPWTHGNKWIAFGCGCQPIP